MLQNKAQMFNDGIVKIYKVEGIQNQTPTLLSTLRYKERTVGYNRYFTALQRDVKVDLLLRCPAVYGLPSKDTDILIAVPKDGAQYRIIQLQYPEDIEPPVMDLSLEKVRDYHDISMASYARLNCLIDVYGKSPTENELGELDFSYTKISSVMAEIIPESGNIQYGEGNTEYADISHKIVVKSGTIESLSNDMYFIFEGQRYDIKYFNPNFKYNDSVEIFCSLVVE